jgi:hypothetical protein
MFVAFEMWKYDKYKLFVYIIASNKKINSIIENLLKFSSQKLQISTEAYFFILFLN